MKKNMDISAKKIFIKLKDLEVYKLSRELSQLAWKIYEGLSWQDKKTMGDQFLSSTDSFGANIAEGYGRYHYLDKIKFFYNARASLTEAINWLEILEERDKASKEESEYFSNIANKAFYKLHNLISANYSQKASLASAD